MQEKNQQPSDTYPVNDAVSLYQDSRFANRHSEDIQAIITKVPGWILRWGIVIWGAILVMGVVIAAIIHYPDTIKTPVKFQTTSKQIYGLIAVREENYAKVRIGQPVIIGLKIYPTEDYGRLRGAISFIPDAPNAQGFFIIKIKLDSTPLKHSIKLKDWMTGSAEVIIQDITVLQRITKSLVKI